MERSLKGECYNSQVDGYEETDMRLSIVQSHILDQKPPEAFSDNR